VPDPTVSVIMPVYNGEGYLRAAIESILTQTFSDFEFLILDDGSTDRSSSIISGYDDPRISILRHSNRGLAGTLNRGISLARGKYVARQDQDDISLPERFEKQVEFLERHPTVGLVGTWARIIAGDAETGRTHNHPSDNGAIKFALMFDNPFVHSSMMIRRSVFDSVGVYTTDPAKQPPEDYELWSRIARAYDVANIPEVLQIYREVPTSMSRDRANPFIDRIINVSVENIALALGREVSDETIVGLSSLIHRAYHRVPPNPSLSRMREDVNELTRRLGETDHAEDEALPRMVRETVHVLNRSYFRYRHRIAGRLVDSFDLAKILIGRLSIYVRSHIGA
jgi:glycosyltransferase involved in cell wall biosynthesis